MGITRLANVTGLDRIGIPVAMAARPNSRSVSVSQGKGQSKQLAFASALMEAAETWHAEDISGLTRFASRRDLMGEAGAIVTPRSLARTQAPFKDDFVTEWVRGLDLINNETCWIPAELVHTDYTLPLRPGNGNFLASTNGLASGNHILEAISAGLCELVERDAVALWHARSPQARAAFQLDLQSVEDPGCQALLDRLAAAGMVVRVWNVTSDVGIPAFLCWIRERDAGSATLQHTSSGAGCHPDRAVALSRALTEAAQTRLNVIVGARDDLPFEYDVLASSVVGPLLLDILAANVPAQRFGDVAEFQSDDLADDVAWELNCLRSVGLDRAIMTDLTRPEIGLPIVRLVVPALEPNCSHPDYMAGARARRVALLA